MQRFLVMMIFYLVPILATMTCTLETIFIRKNQRLKYKKPVRAFFHCNEGNWIFQSCFVNHVK